MNSDKGVSIQSQSIFARTALLESTALSQLLKCKVYLKLENNQPCGSFKLRGLSNVICKKVANGCKRLVASSGGNAGMAAAFVARKLGVPLTLYVPQTTGQWMRDKLIAEGATVIVHGAFWDEANAKAEEEATDPAVGYIHPFDHPDVWEGHESLITEIAEIITTPPDLVIVSVGGGGLLIGIAQGMARVGWDQVPILGMETDGANCFNAAIKANKIVTLSKITSIANCLGALTVCSEAFRLASVRPIISETVSDQECVRAMAKFLDDHRILVEPACGAAIAAIYSGTIQRLQEEGKLPAKLNSIVLVVCGGVGVSAEMLGNWKKEFNV